MRRPGPVLITGGAGFLGTNLADRLAREGERVRVLDDLSRPGVEASLEWLLTTHGDRIEAVIGDVRDRNVVDQALADASSVFHFAAQVAVTTSLAQPRQDFEVNVLGTLNVLETIRRRENPPPLFFTSTNKVYGALEDLELTRVGERYLPADPDVRRRGVSEDRPLEFHSPYGCSKGSADQYVIDYARSYDLPAAVFRMSCIYGPHQCGTEDQGWVAHFLASALEGRRITLYGDGRQVRDVLYVDDLVDAMLLGRSRIDRVAGQAFNLGGGPENCVSLLELLELIGELHGEAPRIQREAWRPGDQRYYVSDTGRFRSTTGWRPRVPLGDGVARLYRWLAEEASVSPGRSLESPEIGGLAPSVVAEGGAA